MKAKCWISVLVALFICSAASASLAANAALTYPVKVEDHQGGDVAPTKAYEMAKDNPHVFIVDVRSRPEYVLIGHPTIAHHIPLKFWTGKHTSKGYGMATNKNFGQDLMKTFNPKTDTLIFMCRSGKRSCFAANEAVKAGWPADKVLNMMGGFEGDKVSNSLSAYNGQRLLGGWKNEGLPWTYKVDPKLAYSEAQ